MDTRAMVHFTSVCLCFWFGVRALVQMWLGCCDWYVLVFSNKTCTLSVYILSLVMGRGVYLCKPLVTQIMSCLLPHGQPALGEIFKITPSLHGLCLLHAPALVVFLHILLGWLARLWCALHEVLVPCAVSSATHMWMPPTCNQPKCCKRERRV